MNFHRATELQVTCINKRTGHYNPHERISHIGGYGWKHAESTAISNIELGLYAYYVGSGFSKVKVIVATRNGRKYLKTQSDGEDPNNLLSLPECM